MNGALTPRGGSASAADYCELTLGSHDLLVFAGDMATRFWEAGEISRLSSEQTGEERWLLGDTMELGRLQPWRSGVLSETSVSRQHATLSRRGSLWILADHSTHGTLLNGGRIHQQQASLLAGDRLQLGTSTLVYNTLKLKKD